MYGSDFKLDDSGDIIFTADGDLEIISGPALVLQDIREELQVPTGSVEWDRAAGSDMSLFLNDNSVTGFMIITELEKLALRDPRIDAESVKAEAGPDGGFLLSFLPAGKEDLLALNWETGGHNE